MCPCIFEQKSNICCSLEVEEAAVSYNLFFQKSDLGFWSNIFWLIDILPLGSGSVDPHIFADPDPDPESQNLLDPTDLDLGPKHCVQETLSDKFIS